MLGEPNFPDSPIPSWEEFDEDYLDYYFDGTKPKEGRCFIILNDDVELGQINYNPINDKTKTTEIDIWLSDKKHTRQGIGTKAINLLSKHLFKNFGCKKIVIQPSARNKIAIKAYRKAGFIEQSQIPKDFELDYFDSVFMVLNSDKIIH